MPWGAWVTCEETVNGPDVGPDFTGASNAPLTKRHGYVFEVPIDGRSAGRPVRSAGRFSHEAVSFDPVGGHLYLTEDNFGFPSGFYRYTPPAHPMRVGELRDGGTLEMLKVVDRPNAALHEAQPAHATYQVEWVRIETRTSPVTMTLRPTRARRTTRRSPASATRGAPTGRRGSPGWRGRPTRTGWCTSAPRDQQRRRHPRTV